MIERVRNGALSRPPARAVMFDFDGTIAMVRAGWMPIMLDMMMETLAPLAGDAASLRFEAEEYVARLTGKDTLHQMEAFARHVRELGGHAQPAAAYKAEFIRRIDRLRIERLSAIEQGAISPDALLVPGIRNLLQNLRDRGLQLYLASGSAHEEICMESDLLGIAHYFDGIYGSAPTSRTKRELLEWLTSSGIPGNRILTFGDGRVEIEDTRAIGGTAVGVATDEPACRDVDCRKRGWLIDAGADYIIPNYLEEDLLLLVSGEI
ncbi:MAG TPA: HAD family hydrolase [Bryobacteraceae bacterium]|nr:HAD family hydrolase [Bryobacteraceae bacterium]